MKRCVVARQLRICLFVFLIQIVIGLPIESISAAETPSCKQQPIGGAAEVDTPMSIFNDTLRAFKFRLEHEVVNVETAEAFSLIYKGRDRPAIIGAYPDADTNSLIVVGPPEAEQAIRETLATWMVESFGPAEGSLKITRRGLAFDRQRFIETLAQLEIEMVAFEGGENAEAKIEQLKARAKSIAGELAAVERQLEVADRYLRKLADIQEDE